MKDNKEETLSEIPEDKASQEYLEKRNFLLIERQNIKLKHELRMKEFDREQANMQFFHDHDVERIKMKFEEKRKAEEQYQRSRWSK